MKKFASMLLAGAAIAVSAASIQAAPKGTLDLRMNVTETSAGSGVYDVQIQGRATGTANAGQGDGGLSDLQFNITSNGTGKVNAVAAGVGPLAGKSKITWDPAVTGGFSTVNPNRSDAAPADGDFDVVGGAFFDSNNFTKTDLAVGAFQTLATVQFTLAPGQNDVLHLTPSNVQYYDFINGTSPNFRGTFATINSVDAPIPTPEPATLSLVGLGMLSLAARRRRA